MGILWGFIRNYIVFKCCRIPGISGGGDGMLYTGEGGRGGSI